VGIPLPAKDCEIVYAIDPGRCPGDTPARSNDHRGKLQRTPDEQKLEKIWMRVRKDSGKLFHVVLLSLQINYTGPPTLEVIRRAGKTVEL
jgi:hypothetical protein